MADNKKQDIRPKCFQCEEHGPTYRVKLLGKEDITLFCCYWCYYYNHLLKDATASNEK